LSLRSGVNLDLLDFCNVSCLFVSEEGGHESVVFFQITLKISEIEILRGYQYYIIL